MKRRLLIPAICLSGTMVVYLISLWEYSLPVPWAVLFYVIVFGNVFLGLSLFRIPAPTALLVCGAAIAFTILVLRTTTRRILLPQAYYEATSMRSLDKMMWKQSRGQFLFVRVDFAKFETPVVVTSEGKPIHDLADLEMVFERSLGRNLPMGYRFGACDLAFRATSVVISASEGDGGAR